MNSQNQLVFSYFSSLVNMGQHFILRDTVQSLREFLHAESGAQSLSGVCLLGDG